MCFTWCQRRWTPRPDRSRLSCSSSPARTSHAQQSILNRRARGAAARSNTGRGGARWRRARTSVVKRLAVWLTTVAGARMWKSTSTLSSSCSARRPPPAGAHRAFSAGGPTETAVQQQRPPTPAAAEVMLSTMTLSCETAAPPPSELAIDTWKPTARQTSI